MPDGPNVSYPFGDGQPPANLPVAGDAAPIEIHPFIRLDGEQLFMNQMLDLAASLQADGDGYTVDFGADW